MKAIEPSVKIRPMQQGDIEQAMRLKDLEGWNQTEQDWEMLLKLSSETCFVAVCDKEVIGTITAVNYSNELAWIGMMLIAEKYRRKGIGSLLLNHNMKRLQEYKTIGLDATPLGRNVYIKLGFEEEYIISRMATSSLPKQTITDSGTFITPISSHDIQEIATLDKAVSGAVRTNLIELLSERYPEKALKLEKDGRIAGYCLGRDGVKHNHLGPVIALTTKDAKTLLSAAMSRLVGQPVVIDVPVKKRQLLQWLVSIAFREQRSLIRMFYKSNPVSESGDGLFAICGPEFG